MKTDEQHKICKICGLDKDLSEFYECSGCKDGHRGQCIKCHNNKKLIHYHNNKKIINLKRKEKYTTNPLLQKEVRNRSKKWLRENPEKYADYINRNREKIALKRKEYRLIYAKENREKLLKSKRDSYKRNKDHVLEYQKDYYKNNVDRVKNRVKEWSEKNKEGMKIKKREYIKNRKKKDNLFKLTKAIRTRIYQSIVMGGYTKKSATFKILGCSFEYFKDYIQSKWSSWMNWDNYGKYNGEIDYGWDLDHIIPTSSAKTEEEVIKLNHYTNFQPLCSFKNRYIKKDKINEETSVFIVSL